ncbi:hypothetical protein J2046_002778 [Rhizobium petrolearium]|uniref:hypothetical protein n=1 Tax=Neorhizobium petrolearium TaxID=515361 RepID=UPI001F31153E|nr:hypothetical protein [Neorhizobium petrolearium]MBP1844519.1 hypothetical protein [Neorhizobium petrolearium]
MIADVAIKIHWPFGCPSAKEVTFLWPPKHHIPEAEADLSDGSALFFNRFRQQVEERRGGSLQEQESAWRHVAQPVEAIGDFRYGIDGGTALVKIAFAFLSTNSAIEIAYKRVLRVMESPAAMATE